jgi:hypothetical protein
LSDERLNGTEALPTMRTDRRGQTTPGDDREDLTAKGYAFGREEPAVVPLTVGYQVLFEHPDEALMPAGRNC